MFKVGDKVVYVSNAVDVFDNLGVHEVSAVIEDRLYKVQGLYFSRNGIRHATPEEIKLGHRIEQVNTNETN